MILPRKPKKKPKPDEIFQIFATNRFNDAMAICDTLGIKFHIRYNNVKKCLEFYPDQQSIDTISEIKAIEFHARYSL